MNTEDNKLLSLTIEEQMEINGGEKKIIGYEIKDGQLIPVYGRSLNQPITFE